MDLITALGLGMRYSNKGKGISLIVSFAVSVFFRILPVLLAVHYGSTWLALYCFPIWIGIELLLVGLFAFWGLSGVILSFLVTSFLHPLTVILPSTLVALEVLLILFQVLVFWSNWFDYLTDMPILNYLLSVLTPCLTAGLVSGILSTIAGIHLEAPCCIEILFISIQYFVAIFLCGFPSLILLNKRRLYPRGWTSEWFLLLFGDGDSQCYPSPTALEYNRGTPYQVDSNHQNQRNQQDITNFVTITTSGEVVCPNCGTNNWPTRSRCRRCRTRL